MRAIFVVIAKVHAESNRQQSCCILAFKAQ